MGVVSGLFEADGVSEVVCGKFSTGAVAGLEFSVVVAPEVTLRAGAASITSGEPTCTDCPFERYAEFSFENA